MLKKFLNNIFNPDVTVTPQNTPKKEQNKNFHQQQSNELFQRARDVFDNGDVNTAIELINEANEHLVRTFAKSEDEVRNAARFFGVNKEANRAVKTIKLPIKGIKKEELDLIHKEMSWFALNGIKANYSLMSFLMFREYEWKEFDEELQRAKNSNNPEEYEIYYFIKNELKEKADLSVYRERFYSLSLDARVLLASYNAIGRKRHLKDVDVEDFYRERGVEELKDAGYIHSTDNEVIIEFPVEEKKQVMFEKKKLEALMRHLLVSVHWKKEYKYGKSKVKKVDAPNAVFLVSGTGGSTLCKKEVIPVKDATTNNFKSHSIGCKCHVSFIGRPERV